MWGTDPISPQSVIPNHGFRSMKNVFVCLSKIPRFKKDFAMLRTMGHLMTPMYIWVCIWQYMYMLYQVISILIYQLWIINYPRVSLIIPMFWSDFVSWPISTLKKKYDKIGVTPRGFATFFTPVATLGAGPGIDPRSQRPGLRWLHGLISLV